MSVAPVQVEQLVVWVPKHPTLIRPLARPADEIVARTGLRSEQQPAADRPLLVVVSCAADLEAARTAANKHFVMVWLWLCPESLAWQAEREFSCVTGVPTLEQLRGAISRPVEETSLTRLLARTESMLQFPITIVLEDETG